MLSMLSVVWLSNGVAGEHCWLWISSILVIWTLCFFVIYVSSCAALIAVRLLTLTCDHSLISLFSQGMKPRRRSCSTATSPRTSGCRRQILPQGSGWFGWSSALGQLPVVQTVFFVLFHQCLFLSFVRNCLSLIPSGVNCQCWSVVTCLNVELLSLVWCELFHPKLKFEVAFNS